MNIRTRLAAAALAGLAIAGLAIAAAGATTASAVGPTAGLPAASGRPVGVTTLNLTDRSRQDPWTHGGARRIVVSAFYPARRAVRSPARYVSPALADALAQAYQVPPAPWRAVRTHAGAGVAARPGRHPIVLVSPGAVMPRSSVTLVAEDLAAHGYVALVLDHPGDAAAVDLPGGEIRPVDAGFLAGVLSGQPDIDKAVRIRIADVRFVLDRLPAIGRRGVLRDRLDRNRIAIVGHSIGGSPAANVMLADRRVDVGVNYDGDYFLDAAKRAPRRPFMTMTGGASDNQRAFFARQRWPGLLVTLAGAQHETFTDLSYLSSLYGPAFPAEIGTIPPDKALAAQRAYTRAFLAHHLLGRPASRLLTHRTSRRHPAVTVQFAAPSRNGTSG